jgi:ECF sigma factor
MGFDAELTSALNSGNADERDRLLGIVHEDLRRIARAELARHRRGETLNTQALVNEAYLKLFGGSAASFENRKHFFATAARAMRQIVIDYARARLADCRGAGAEHVPLDALEILPLAIDAQAEQLIRAWPKWWSCASSPDSTSRKWPNCSACPHPRSSATRAPPRHFWRASWVSEPEPAFLHMIRGTRTDRITALPAENDNANA